MIPVLLAFGASARLASPQDAGTHPVLISPASLDRAKKRAKDHPWARAAVDRIVRDADAWLARPRALPEGEAGLYHDYFCPDHGVLLEYSPDRPKAHRCPVDGREWRGAKLDAYWVHLTLRSRLEAAAQCALAWHFTGKEPYARAACDILLEHAAYYRDHIRRRTPPRWMAQSLDEAVQILDAARAFDLLAGPGSGLSEDARARISRDYLLPTAEFLLGERRRIHNIDCWYDAAVAAIAATTGERTLLARAVGTAPGSRWGLRDQLRQGVSREGLWREGSIGYHFYTLAAVVETLAPARELGCDLEPELEVVRSMFLAPLAMADARGLIPPDNDGPPRSVDAYLALYERGAGLFPDAPELTAFLARAYGGRWRTSREALLHGPESLPADPAPGAGSSRSFPDSGFAVLRTRPAHLGKDGEVYAMLDFGPHGGYHGHLDKLSVALHGLGRVLSPDTGTSGYGLPLTTRWYRQTLSHNTVLVDRRSQQPATGKLVSFAKEGPLHHVIASAGNAYPGVLWTRGVFLAEEGYVVVLDRLRPAKDDDRERIFDWAWQGFGELHLAFPPLGPVDDPKVFGSEDGYQVARELRSGITSGPVEARWIILPQTPTQPPDARPGTGGSLRLWLGAAPRTTVFSAEVPGNPIRDCLAKIVVRRQGTRADFAAVLEPVPEGSRPVVATVKPVPGGVEVVTDGGRRTVTLPPSE